MGILVQRQLGALAQGIDPRLNTKPQQSKRRLMTHTLVLAVFALMLSIAWLTPKAYATEFLVNTTTARGQADPSVAELSNGSFIIIWEDDSQEGDDTNSSEIRARRYDVSGLGIGDDFVVNTTFIGRQSAPSITGLSNGGFAITWQDDSPGEDDPSSSAIRARHYNVDGNAQGDDFGVNTTTQNAQRAPRIAGLDNGGFVITWQDDSATGLDNESSAIRAQRYDANGVTQGVEFLVNSTIEGGQRAPSIAGLDNGGFVIAWQDDSLKGADTSSSAIRARRYDANGVAQDIDFQVNTTTTNSQRDASIASLDNGGFVIAWQDDSAAGVDTSSSAIRARRYDANGVDQGGDFEVNTTITGGQRTPRIAGLDNGGFAITWQDDSATGLDNDSSAIRARQYNANGVAQGIDFEVNTITASSQDEPDIASLSNGNFVITWRDFSRSSPDINSFAIRADIFQDANDAAPEGEFLVNTTTTDHQRDPSIAELVGGGFVITWEDDNQAIRAQRYAANGVAQGNEFLVNTTAANILTPSFIPSIAGLENGGFVITWGDLSTIRAQRYNANGMAQGAEFVISTTAFSPATPSITGLSNGGFVITWEDHTADIRAQRYNSDGVAQGGEFLVNSITEDIQNRPSIAGLGNGGFVITWTDDSQTGDDTDSFAVRAQRYDANGVRQGTEFLVNTTTARFQHEPSIAGLDNGGFVITWTDNSDTSNAVRARRYNANGVAQGGDFLVNTTVPNDQDEPSVAGLGNGGFVITWQDFSRSGGDDSSHAVRAQRYDANGVAQGGEFLVNTTTEDFQGEPSIAGLGNSGFVITWADDSQTGGDTSGEAIRAQLYAANGVAPGGEFLVNTSTTGAQEIPSIAELNGGGFVITWADFSGTGADHDSFAVRAQRYNANGVSQGNEFLVNTAIGGDQTASRVAGLGNGGFVITWQDGSLKADDGDSFAVRAQRYDANGVEQGAEFLVNTIKRSFQGDPSIASLGNGGFVITWEDDSLSDDDASFNAVRAQRYDANGVAQGIEFLVNTATTNTQRDPSVAGLGGGGFVITWEDNSRIQGDTDGFAIRAQRYDANGLEQGVELLVNTSTDGNQRDPRIAGLGDGGFVITWEDGNEALDDNSGFAIRAQRYDANGVRQGTEFLVNTSTDSNQVDPSIAGLGNGGFVITWEDLSELEGDTDSFAVRGQRYDANGLAQGHEFLVNTTTAGAQVDPSITGLGNGSFVITWMDNSAIVGDTDGSAIRAAIFNASSSGAPEIDIAGNGVSITDGDTTPAVADDTDFGAVGLLGGSNANTFTITNSGTAVLNITGISITGANAADFALTTDAANSITSGGVSPFTITFNASAVGARTANVSITSDDADENPYTFDIAGTGVGAPEINIAGNGVSIADGDITPSVADGTDFGNVDLADGNNANTFIINNSGTATLNLTGTPRVSITGANAADFTLTTDAATSVALGGGTANFTITFDASAIGVRTANVSIANDDANENPYNFNIRGIGETVAPVLFSSVLPSARSGFIGGPAITVFASVINATTSTARNCRVVIPGAAPVTLSYQPTDAANAPVGAPDQVFDIPGNEIRSFVLAFTPTSVSTGEDVFPDFMCDNANVGAIPGVNTAFLSVDTVAGPDILSISATPSANGIIEIPASGASFMTVSVINIGAGDTEGSDDATITTSVDTGATALPLLLQICETDELSNCITPLSTSITDTIGSVPSFFAVFVTDQSAGGIPLDPANARVFLRFTDEDGTVRSVTSAAVTATAPADAPMASAGELPLGRWAVTVRTVTSPFQQQIPGVLYVTADGAAELNYGETILPFTIAPPTDPGNFLTQTENTIIVGVFEPNRSIALIATNPQTHLEIWGVQDTRIDGMAAQ